MFEYMLFYTRARYVLCSRMDANLLHQCSSNQFCTTSLYSSAYCFIPGPGMSLGSRMDANFLQQCSSNQFHLQFTIIDFGYVGPILVLFFLLGIRRPIICSHISKPFLLNGGGGGGGGIISVFEFNSFFYFIIIVNVDALCFGEKKNYCRSSNITDCKVLRACNDVHSLLCCFSIGLFLFVVLLPLGVASLDSYSVHHTAYGRSTQRRS